MEEIGLVTPTPGVYTVHLIVAGCVSGMKKQSLTPKDPLPPTNNNMYKPGGLGIGVNMGRNGPIGKWLI